MKNIARELNVSVVTVSKALRNHDDISQETRGKVLELMERMNYRPNLAARALVTGRSFIVGFVVPSLLHSFFAEVAKGLTNVFRRKGYGLVIATSEEDPELESQEIEQLLARRVDALIVASTQTDGAIFARIESQGIPYVLIDRRIEGLDANFVGVDDSQVGHMATEHLIQCGYRRVACICGSTLSPSLGRLAGYRRALEKHGIAWCPDYVRALEESGEESDDAAYTTMKELLALGDPPDGVYCFNDPSALNAMKAVLDAGLRIPEDVAIVGSGNIRHADFLRVPLTTIDQNSIAMGERAGKLALTLIESPGPQKTRTALLEPRLVMRASSMRIPGMRIPG